MGSRTDDSETVFYDTLGPLEAERAWLIQEGKLGAVGNWYAHRTLQWSAGRNRARCHAALYGGAFTDAAAHAGSSRSPNEKCSCGFWAVPDIIEYMAKNTVVFEGDVVLGRVKLWGKVIPYTKGWRAERAEVIELWGKEVEGFTTVEAHPEVCGYYRLIDRAYAYPTWMVMTTASIKNGAVTFTNSDDLPYTATFARMATDDE
jgi:hypothetical protein